MKKLIYIIAFILTASAVDFSLAQTDQNSWSFGFGFSYPRFLSTGVPSQKSNYGGFLSFQRNFNESFSLRLLTNYNHIYGRIGYDPTINKYYYTDGTKVTSPAYMHSNVFSINLDILYYLGHYFAFSPYLVGGIAITSLNPQWPSNIVNPNVKTVGAAQVNLALGNEWNISSGWNLKTEFGYHSTDGHLDGVITNQHHGMFGFYADGYVSFNAGVVYSF